jgi:thiol-disulfide isomerase/thioredoxin
MIERAVLVAGVVALACLTAYIVRRRSRSHSQTLAGSSLPAELATGLNPSAAGIVYFYGPHCATCRRQAGVLEGLSDADRISILHIDASRETRLADQFGVMTVPATVVVDRSRHVRSVNLGFRSADELREQLKSASG